MVLVTKSTVRLPRGLQARHTTLFVRFSNFFYRIPHFETSIIFIKILIGCVTTHNDYRP